MSWKGVITDKGRELMEQWAGGGQVLTIESASVGSGTVAETAMKSATALTHPEADAQIASRKATEQGMQIKVLIGPAEESGYTAKEIGLWARLGSGQSVLFALHQDVGGTGVSVPTASVSPNFAFAIFLVHTLSDEGSIRVVTDSNVYITEASFEEAMEEIDGKLSFPDGLTPTGPLVLKQGVHYFMSEDDLPQPGTPGRIAFVKAQ